MTHRPTVRTNRLSRLVATLVVAGTLGACAETGKAPPKPAPPVAAAITPQNDLYRAVNQAWLATNEIPDDRASWGAFAQLRDEAITQLKGVIDEAEAAGPKGTPDQRKIAALYASFMDEQRLEGLGGKPIAAQVRMIDGIRSKRELPAVIAQMNEVAIVAPISVYIGQDAREPYALHPDDLAKRPGPAGPRLLPEKR